MGRDPCDRVVQVLSVGKVSTNFSAHIGQLQYPEHLECFFGNRVPMFSSSCNESGD